MAWLTLTCVLLVLLALAGLVREVPKSTVSAEHCALIVRCAQ
jgi:hypothetical protein